MRGFGTPTGRERGELDNLPARDLLQCLGEIKEAALSRQPVAAASARGDGVVSSIRQLKTYIMAYPGRVYYAGMQPGQNAVYPVNHGAAAPPSHRLSPAPTQMPTPRRPAGCPPGLEDLTQIDQILIHRKAKPLFRWMKNNVYTVKNSVGKQLFEAMEENDFSTWPSSRNRSFTIHLHDNRAREVLTVIRHIEFMCCFCQSFQELEVQSPPGKTIGYVEYSMHSFIPKFTILDDTRTPVLKIKRPGWESMCMSDVIFKVMSLDKSAVVGQIWKEWRGFSFSNADNFGISFPIDLDVKIKAVLIGACFLIDVMFYDNKS